MENATKALMIAGAVLIAILVISLGITIFTSASEQMGNLDMTEYQKQQFNMKFTKYEGKRTGAEVNALLNTVFTHNNAQEDNSTCVLVSYTANGSAKIIEAKNTLTTSPVKVPISKKYTVNIYYDKGIVKSIGILQN